MFKIDQIQQIQHAKPVDDDIPLHKKGWVVQRIGWALMFLFLLAALLGVFGEGPLSSKTVQAGNIKVKYERFCRYEHEVEIKLESTGEDIRAVALSQEYLRKFKVSKIVPEPFSQLASPGFINYQFPGNQNTTIIFYLSPVERGSAEGRIKINNYQITINQFIYP